MSNYLPLILPTDGEDLSSEFAASEENRKRLGQCFTGIKTARLLSALVPPGKYSVVLDPMAGHGDLLEAVAERFATRNYLGYGLIGVEIEPGAASCGVGRLERCRKRFDSGESTYHCADAFEPKTWAGNSTFDLVIANPPYVRYQTLSKQSGSTPKTSRKN